jgi:hypothetical protein
MLIEVYEKLKQEFLENQTDSEVVQEIMEDLSKWVLANIEIILARFATRVKLYTEDNGLLSSRALLKELANDKEMLALFIMFRHSKRASLIPKQNTDAQRNYCSLVPFLLYPFKRYKDIPYSKWSVLESQHLFIPGLNDAMFSEDLKTAMTLGSEQILEARKEALRIKSGANVNGQRNPATTFTLYPAKDTIFARLSNIGKCIAFQAWCAHPNNRNSYMILDPSDWDKIPAPIIETEPFWEPTKSKIMSKAKSKSKQDNSDEPLWV